MALPDYLDLEKLEPFDPPTRINKDGRLYSCVEKAYYELLLAEEIKEYLIIESLIYSFEEMINK